MDEMQTIAIAAGASAGAFFFIMLVVAIVVFVCRKRKDKPATVAPHAAQEMRAINEYQAVFLKAPTYDVGELELPREEEQRPAKVQTRGIVVGDTGVGTNYGPL
jgi:hypothetical protein